VVLVTIGTLFLIQSVGGPDFGRTWPVLLLAIGLVKLLDGKNMPQPPSPPMPTAPGAGGSGGVPAGVVSPSSNEVQNG
jgi:hypothetical protein